MGAPFSFRIFLLVGPTEVAWGAGFFLATLTGVFYVGVAIGSVYAVADYLQLLYHCFLHRRFHVFLFHCYLITIFFPL